MRRDGVGAQEGLQRRPAAASGFGWWGELSRRTDLSAHRRAVEFLRFSAVGLSGVGVNLGLYLLLTRAGRLSIYFAAPLSIEASVFSNFFLNNVWTFRHRRVPAPILQRLIRFHAVCALGGIVNYLVLLVLAVSFGWSDVVANLAGITAGVAVTFSMHSTWTWRERTRGRSPEAVEGD